jgi:3-hydroxyacyl-CoA dehydrogenase / 3-hydroxy-2-methylbutyryl-CoA dehydrogenase
MQIDGSSALVAGGASGLGEGTVRALHERGALVTIADVNDERGHALAAELGERAAFEHADVRSADEVQAAVAAAAQAPGGLRISIHCAGVGWAEKIAGKRGPHQLEFFEKVIAINLIGTFNVLRFSSAAMIATEPLEGGAAGRRPTSRGGRDPNHSQPGDGERGVCVNTASIAAFDGQVGQIAYSASKGGVVGMTLPAARDLAQYGVRVNTIAPGLFDTPLLGALPEEAREKLGAGVPFPQRLGQPAEYAQLACQIVENRMLNGETIRLDGALRMPPR